MKFLKSRIFLLNILLSFVIGFAILAGIYFWLDSYTLHNESITVPDLRGKYPSVAEKILAEKKLVYKIIDSSAYNKDFPRGTILEQDPEPGAGVKENRKIYLTVNPYAPSMIKMPDLTEASFRQAEAILHTYGLKVGKIDYKPYFAKNVVLQQLYRGRLVKPGELIPRESEISLVLGDGLRETEKTFLPSLVGMTLEQALATLKTHMLNWDVIVKDASVTDSLNAVVYKQIPSYSSDATISQGSSVTLFITQSPDKISSGKDDTQPKLQ